MTTASKSAAASARHADGLAAPDKFYAAIRPLFGKITTPQFEGMQAKLDAFAAAASPLAYVAYDHRWAWQRSRAHSDAHAGYGHKPATLARPVPHGEPFERHRR